VSAIQVYEGDGVDHGWCDPFLIESLQHRMLIDHQAIRHAHDMRVVLCATEGDTKPVSPWATLIVQPHDAAHRELTDWFTCMDGGVPWSEYVKAGVNDLPRANITFRRCDGKPLSYILRDAYPDALWYSEENKDYRCRLRCRNLEAVYLYP
jgi:hypothetical protein